MNSKIEELKDLKDLKNLLAHNLRSARERMGYSQQRLAEAAHISPGHMNDIEQARKWVSAETLGNLASALMTEPWTLLLPEDQARLRYDNDLLMSFTAILQKNFGHMITTSWEEAIHSTSESEQ
ncbi:MAG: helix-turn-helix transcriptional regulator [Alkalispirochaeta sp.]